MNMEEDDVDGVDIGALIESLFGMESGALRAMGPPQYKHNNDAALLGLQEFLRRIFLRVLQLRDTDVETLSLNAESPVGEWPDARTARLANLIVSATVVGWRPHRRLPFLALVNKKGSTLRQLDKQLTEMPIANVLNELRGLRTAQSPHHEFSPRYPMSIVALIEELLRIDPRQLAARFYDRDARIAEGYSQAPEHSAQLGLAHMISDAIYQYRIMRKRNIDRIRLMSEGDAKIARRPSARMANMITVLSAAIHADDEHVIVFEPPKVPLAEEDQLLRAAAKLVNLDPSFEGRKALELLCERNIHFGSFDRFSRADELLHEVGAG